MANDSADEFKNDEGLASSGVQSIEISSRAREDDPLLSRVSTADPPPPLPGEASVWRATLNIINFIEGVGFLALPFAVMKGGIAGVIMFVLMPLIYWFTAKVLIDCLYQSHDLHGNIRVRSTWKEIGEAVWPRYGGELVTAVQCFDLTVIATSYLIVCGSLMKCALPSVPLKEAHWTCIAAAIVLPTTFLKSLSQIAWLSVIGIVALVGTEVVVLWYGGTHSSQWDIKQLMFWDTEGFLVSLGIIMFSYGSAPILPSVEGSMSDKTKFGRALGLAYIAAVLFKISFSVCGFLSFPSTDEVVINNLPLGPVHFTVSLVFVLSCLFSYALPLQAVFQYIEEASFYLWAEQKVKLPELVYAITPRIFLVTLTLAAAVTIPHFGLLTSFIGNLSLPLFNCIFPCTAHILLKKSELKQHQLIMDGAMIVFGVVASLLGIFFSSKALRDALKYQ